MQLRPAQRSAREEPRVHGGMLGHAGETALIHGLGTAVAERLVVSKSGSPMLVEQ